VTGGVISVAAENDPGDHLTVLTSPLLRIPVAFAEDLVQRPTDQLVSLVVCIGQMPGEKVPGDGV